MADGVSGVILAGGSSRRMGREKAHLAWGGGTLIEHVIETLRPLVDELLVVTKDANKLGCLEIRVVEDVVPDAHALGGLYTGLMIASNDRCFVCACDMPFLNPQLISFLCEQADGFDLVIPRTSDGLQPLHAVYAKSALPAVAQQLRARRQDLCAIARQVRAKIIEPAVLARYDPAGLSCVNLNTPAEYAMARVCRERLTHVIDPALELVYRGRKLGDGRNGG